MLMQMTGGMLTKWIMDELRKHAIPWKQHGLRPMSCSRNWYILCQVAATKLTSVWGMPPPTLIEVSEGLRFLIPLSALQLRSTKVSEMDSFYKYWLSEQWENT